MIEREDLRIFSKLGNALWIDPGSSEKSTLDTLSAISLLELAPERALEKACTALLARASKRSTCVQTDVDAGKLAQPFFRLSLEERFILVALHLGKWSYQRLSRILSCSKESLEARAWVARLQLGCSYPAAPHPIGHSCPEYLPGRPWTQRFLDTEFVSGREKFFFQDHLTLCSACRDGLNRCRETYYRVDQALRHALGDHDFGELLEDVLRLRRVYRTPAHRTFVESLTLFIQKKDIQLLVGLLFCLLVFQGLRQVIKYFFSP